MRRHGVLLMALFWVNLATSGQALDQLIIPGLRVGPVTLGETLETLTRHLGAGQAYRSRTYTNLLYHGFTVVVTNGSHQTVQAVVVTDPPYHLRDGIGIGTPEKTVLHLLGTPSQSQLMGGQTKGMIDKSLNYAHLGLTLALARSKVVQIGIYQRK